MFISGALAESDDFSRARGLADFMQEHYGVTILIGDECKAVEPFGFQIGDTPGGVSPLLKMLGWYSFEDDIKRIDDYFSFYPPGFFEKFRCAEAENGLRILLVLQFLVEGTPMPSATNVQDGYYNVYLAVNIFNRLNFHHEIWHAMDYRITSEDPDAFADWNGLNPVGFQYDYDYFMKDIWEHAEPMDDWFVRQYSTVNEMEDRATVIEAIFDHDHAWWKDRPHLKDKRDRLLEAAEPIFGNVYYPE